jgi:hypothetical protein
MSNSIQTRASDRAQPHKCRAPPQPTADCPLVGVWLRVWCMRMRTEPRKGLWGSFIWSTAVGGLLKLVIISRVCVFEQTHPMRYERAFR